MQILLDKNNIFTIFFAFFILIYDYVFSLVAGFKEHSAFEKAVIKANVRSW